MRVRKGPHGAAASAAYALHKSTLRFNFAKRIWILLLQIRPLNGFFFGLFYVYFRQRHKTDTKSGLFFACLN